MNMRWAILPAGFFIMLCLGTVYSWSVFRIPLQQNYGFSALESGLPFTVLLLTYALSMAVNGPVIRRYPSRPLLIGGGFLVGLGWFLTGTTQSALLKTLYYGIITGWGVGLVYGIPLAVCTEYFPRHRGLAMGVVLAGFGLSAIVTAPLLQAFIATIGISATFQIMGIVFFLIITLFSVFIPPIQGKQESHNQTVSLRSCIANPFFQRLWVLYLLGALAGLTAISIASPVGIEMAQQSPESVASWMALFALCNGAGRPLFGFLTDRWGFQKTASLNYGLIILASLSALTIPVFGVPLFVGSFCLFWFSLGGWLAIAPAVTAHHFEKHLYQKIYGYVFTAYGTASLIGISSAGVLRDFTGSYESVFFVTMGGALVGLFLLWKGGSGASAT
ncbi:MAG: OFA family MFS transporter [Treponemataceae bacterium]|nr:OFA family MFS transporter [Treponemataceae bacterium]